MSARCARQSARDELIDQHSNLVHRIVRRLIAVLRLPPQDYDEYVAAGFLGLVEAAERFDPEKGSDFKRYAYLRIRGAVVDVLRRSSDISPRAYRYAKAMGGLLEAREHFFDVHRVRSTSNAEVQQAKLAGLLEYILQGGIVFRMTVGEPLAESEELMQSAHTPFGELVRREQYRLLRRIVCELPPNERRVIQGYYFEDRSFTDISRDPPAISKSWISRLHTRALQRVRERYLDAVMDRTPSSGIDPTDRVNIPNTSGSKRCFV